MSPRAGRAPFFYGWIAVMAAFLGLMTVAGFRFSFSAFIRPWETEFGWTRDMVSVVGSLSILVWGILPPFAGRLADRYGSRVVISSAVLLTGISTLAAAGVTEYWQLMLTLGFLGGISAAGASPVSAAPLAVRWFTRRRGLALGTISAGVSASQIVVVPLIIFLIVALGWRNALLAVGLANILILAPVIAFFIRSNPESMGLKPYGTAVDSATTTGAPVREERQVSLFQAMRTRPFWLLASGYFVCGFSTLGLITTHLVPYTVGDLHLTEANAAQALAVTGVFDVAGTIFSGYVSDRFGRTIPLGLTYFFRGISYLVLMNAGNPLVLLLWGVIFGMTDIATVPLVASLTGDLYGRRSLGTIYGTLFLSHQIGAAVGAAFGGIIFRQFTFYQPALIVGFILLMGASAASFAIREQRRAPVPKPALT